MRWIVIRFKDTCYISLMVFCCFWQNFLKIIYSFCKFFHKLSVLNVALDFLVLFHCSLNHVFRGYCHRVWLDRALCVILLGWYAFFDCLTVVDSICLHDQLLDICVCFLYEGGENTLDNSGYLYLMKSLFQLKGLKFFEFTNFVLLSHPSLNGHFTNLR